jgi:hypothetical protein
VARIYDYLLGGGHNFEGDRKIAQELLARQPEVRAVARNNRAFMRRAVQYMIGRGVRQFLDLGSGVPTAGTVHEIAQDADPAARVVYVDYEEVAIAHSELLLAGSPAAAALLADATDVEAVMASDQARDLLDLTQPVGLLMITLGHYLPPEANPHAAVADYRDRLASGSFLALSHMSTELDALSDPELVKTMTRTRDHVYPRSRAEILALFDGFDLVEPGLTTTSGWRPDPGGLAAADGVDHDGLYAGVGRKP